MAAQPDNCSEAAAPEECGLRSRALRRRLVGEVRRWPALWDASLPAHRDHQQREACWGHVARALRVDNCEMLKHEWKILRDSLRQSLKTRRGEGARGWHLQETMAFLVPHMTRRVRSVKEENVAVAAMDVEAEPAGGGRAEAGGGRERGEGEGERAGEGEGGELELFFASVCVSARRLPPAARRRLQLDVMQALQRAEGADPH